MGQSGQSQRLDVFIYPGHGFEKQWLDGNFNLLWNHGWKGNIITSYEYVYIKKAVTK